MDWHIILKIIKVVIQIIIDALGGGDDKKDG